MRGIVRRMMPFAVVLIVIATAAPATAAGSWTRQTSPNPAAFVNVLTAVSTESSTDAWAAGLDLDSSGGDCRTLIEHYDGTSWSHVASPNPGTGNDYLYGIKMTSSSNAWAVGTDGTTAASKTLVLRYDGSTWTQQSSPSPDAALNTLTAVSATSATNAWAVGARGFGSPWPDCSEYARPGAASPTIVGLVSERTLIEHYDGTNWTTQGSANPGGCSNALYGVSATSAADAWAAGSWSKDCSEGSDRTLIEHDDGSGWVRMPTPSPGSFGDILFSISAVDPSDVWAVGAELTATGYGSGLFLHYDGAKWTAYKIKKTLTPLFGVKATSSTNVWAVGRDGLDPLIMHFNGTSWKRQTVKAPAGPGVLDGVGATGPGNAFAAGSYEPSTGKDTLVYRYA